MSSATSLPNLAPDAHSPRQSYASFATVSSIASTSTPATPTATHSNLFPNVLHPPLPHKDDDHAQEIGEDGHEKVSATVSVAVFPPEEDDLGKHLAAQPPSASWRGHTRTLPTLHEDQTWDAEYVSFFDLDAEWFEGEAEGGGSDESFDLEAYGYGEYGNAE